MNFKTRDKLLKNVKTFEVICIECSDLKPFDEANHYISGEIDKSSKRIKELFKIISENPVILESFQSQPPP